MYWTHPVSHDQTQVCQGAKLLKENMATVSPWRWKSSPLSAWVCVRTLCLYFLKICESESGKILTGKLEPRRQMARLWWNCWPVVTQTAFKQRSCKAQWGCDELETYFQTGEYIIIIKNFVWGCVQQNYSIFYGYLKKAWQCLHLVSLISFHLPDCLSFVQLYWGSTHCCRLLWTGSKYVIVSVNVRAQWLDAAVLNPLNETPSLLI